MNETTEWLPIGTAPRGPDIDILGKTWDRDSDKFIFKRFTDCNWNIEADNFRGDWRGLDHGYRAVAWMPIPTIPREYPPKKGDS